MEVDLQVGGPVIADSGASERTDDTDPHVLLAHEQRRRMSFEHLSEVALAARLPVRRRLHVEADVGELRRERGRDEKRVLVGVGKDLLGQAVLMVGAVDGERGDSRREPGDSMLAVARVVDRRRSSRRGEEAQLVQRNAVEGGKEDLAQRAVGERVPELAPRTRRRSKSHLAARPPHRGRARTSWGLHRVLSMKGGAARASSYGSRARRIESSDGPDSPGRWLSGRKHPPAKRVGGVKLPRGFESLPSRHRHSGSKLWVWRGGLAVSATRNAPSAASLGIRSRDWSQAQESSS